VALIITFILLGTIFLSYVIGLKKWEEIRTISEINQMGSFALMKMMREIRQAVNLYSVGEEEITLDVDINPKDANPTPERVKYYLEGVGEEKKLMREIYLGPSTLLARHLQNFKITYFDKENQVIDAPQENKESIRMVKVALTLKKYNVNLSLESSVNLRNLSSEE